MRLSWNLPPYTLLNLRQIKHPNHTAIPRLQCIQRAGCAQLDLMRADGFGEYPVALVIACDAEAMFVQAGFAFLHFTRMGPW